MLSHFGEEKRSSKYSELYSEQIRRIRPKSMLYANLCYHILSGKNLHGKNKYSGELREHFVKILNSILLLPNFEFYFVFEKLTHACFYPIALEIMLLPILTRYEFGL